jgi:hypothetical protein
MATYYRLDSEETRETGYTHKVIVPYTDLTGRTKDTLYSLFPTFNTATNNPAGNTVFIVTVRVDTQFTFTAGDLSLSIGDGGSATRFLAASDLKAASLTYYNSAISSEYSYTAADTIDFSLTCSAGTPATISAGQFTVFIGMRDLTRM